MLKNRKSIDVSVSQTCIFHNQQNKLQGDGKQLERQYRQIRHQIVQLIQGQSKPIQIRLKQWLKKFDCVVQVGPWLRNRNLYCRTMLIMIAKKSLVFPFNKHPPTTSLPMLSIYELPFDIREQLQKQKCMNEYSIFLKHDDSNKENQNQNANKSLVHENLSQNRYKQKYTIQNRIIHKSNLQNPSIEDSNNLDKEISLTVRKSYDFLLKNMQKFANEQQVNQLLEQLWHFTAFP